VGRKLKKVGKHCTTTFGPCRQPCFLKLVRLSAASYSL